MIFFFFLKKTLEQAYSISKKFIKKREHLQNTLGKAYLNLFSRAEIYIICQFVRADLIKALNYFKNKPGHFVI